MIALQGIQSPLILYIFNICLGFALVTLAGFADKFADFLTHHDPESNLFSKFFAYTINIGANALAGIGLLTLYGNKDTFDPQVGALIYAILMLISVLTTVIGLHLWLWLWIGNSIDRFLRFMAQERAEPDQAENKTAPSETVIAS